MSDSQNTATENVLMAARAGIKYPAYQLYADNMGATYCSSTKVKSHAVGAAWVKSCLAAHPGTSCNGKPWLSNKQDGTVW